MVLGERRVVVSVADLGELGVLGGVDGSAVLGDGHSVPGLLPLLHPLLSGLWRGEGRVAEGGSPLCQKLSKHTGLKLITEG